MTSTHALATPTPAAGPRVLHANSLVEGEWLPLKGDWIIKGTIPASVTVEVTGGNLTVDGNLRQNVILKNSKGNITFDYADDGCVVTAHRGNIDFIHAGYSSVITGNSITGHTADDGVCLHAKKGDITLNTGKDGTQLIAAGNITFHSVGAFSTLKTPQGTLTYHTIGLKSVVEAADEICTRKKAHTPPSPIVQGATRVGMITPDTLCSGVFYDKVNKNFVLEFDKHSATDAGRAMAALLLQLNARHASVKAFIPEGLHTSFMVSVPENKPELAREIKQLIHTYVKAVKQRETSTQR